MDKCLSSGGGIGDKGNKIIGISTWRTRHSLLNRVRVGRVPGISVAAWMVHHLNRV